jgi:hypothetical protein
MGAAVLAWSTYEFVTHDPTYYLHISFLLLMIVGAWLLVLAVVPVLRAEAGTPHSRLLTIGQWAVVIAILILVGRATR